MQQFHFWVYIIEGKEIAMSKRYLHPYGHCRIIYDSQDMGATKCPLMDER